MIVRCCHICGIRIPKGTAHLHAFCEVQAYEMKAEDCVKIIDAEIKRLRNKLNTFVSERNAVKEMCDAAE